MQACAYLAIVIDISNSFDGSWVHTRNSDSPTVRVGARAVVWRDSAHRTKQVLRSIMTTKRYKTRYCMLAFELTMSAVLFQEKHSALPTLAVWVPNEYRLKRSSPRSIANCDFGTIKCTLPFILQMEQLQTLRRRGD